MHIFQYLENNQVVYKEERKHKSLLNDVTNRAVIIAGRNYGKIYREVSLLNQNSNNEMGRVDLVIPTDLEVILIEAKVSRGKKYSEIRNLINGQLRKGYDFFKENFNIGPRMFGVYRNEWAKDNFHYYELDRPEEDSPLYVRKLRY